LLPLGVVPEQGVRVDARLPVNGAPDNDVAALAGEFPAWDFGVSWITVGSGPDARVLYAWSLEGGPPLTAPDADQMRRKIREATN
jgi:hypothetical protein